VARTASGAVESFWLDVPVNVEEFIPSSIVCNYTCDTAQADNIQIELWKVTQGADDAARTAAVLFGNVDGDYDADHNTAAKRVDDTHAPELHCATVTPSVWAPVPTEPNEMLKIRFYVDGDVGAAAAVELHSCTVRGKTV
jgi:hypothetical protein